MFHTRKPNNHINQLCEKKPLRILHKEKKATYEELLQKDK